MNEWEGGAMGIYGEYWPCNQRDRQTRLETVTEFCITPRTFVYTYYSLRCLFLCVHFVVCCLALYIDLVLFSIHGCHWSIFSDIMIVLPIQKAVSKSHKAMKYFKVRENAVSILK